MQSLSRQKYSWRRAVWLSVKKDTPHCFRNAGWIKLATSYFRGAYRPTIIGATAFHFRVRDGNGWGHCAMVTRLQFTTLRGELSA